MTKQQVYVPNAHFDGAFANWQGIGELTVAVGWAPWWQQGDDPGVLHRPEFKPETMRFEHGQKMFTTFSTHRGGIYQRVPVSERARNFDLFVNCQYWSEHTDGSGGGLGMRCGLDPTGGVDPYAGSIVWGEWHGQGDRPRWDGRARRQTMDGKELARALIQAGLSPAAARNMAVRVKDVQKALQTGTKFPFTPEQQSLIETYAGRPLWFKFNPFLGSSPKEQIAQIDINEQV